MLLMEDPLDWRLPKGSEFKRRSETLVDREAPVNLCYESCLGHLAAVEPVFARAARIFKLDL